MAEGIISRLSAWHQVRALIHRGAAFVLNDSGGKDSQAMRYMVCNALRYEGVCVQRRVLVIHAALGRVEWPGALEHAQAGASREGVPFLVARARRDLIQLVKDRFRVRPDVPSWPSSKCRQCTSDLKRDPITREVRRYAKRNEWHLVVNCLGERGEESPARARRAPLKHVPRNSTTKRDWWDWLPIHGLLREDVFKMIAIAGEKPHPIYEAGNERLSCTFCIFGSGNDLRNGAVLRPDLYREYVELEQRIGYVMHSSRKSLPLITGIETSAAASQEVA